MIPIYLNPLSILQLVISPRFSWTTRSRPSSRWEPKQSTWVKAERSVREYHGSFSRLHSYSQIVSAYGHYNQLPCRVAGYVDCGVTGYFAKSNQSGFNKREVHDHIDMIPWNLHLKRAYFLSLPSELSSNTTQVCLGWYIRSPHIMTLNRFH